jgi:tetratricopeptide (TPR) repeat protein
MIRRLLLGLAALVLAQAACAQVVEDIEVKRESRGNAAITLRLSVRIQYLRSNARKSLLQVYFRIVEGETTARTFLEVRGAPPNDIVPRFTVTYPNLPPGEPRRLDIQFDTPVNARASAGPDGRSIRIELPALAPAPAASAKPPAAAAPSVPSVPVSPVTPAASEVSRKAAALLAQARSAVQEKRWDAAVETLNELLNLPPTPASREAQELIGFAREQRGERAKAQAEYELFLKLYPQGPDADRVRSRLADLVPAAPRETAGAEPAAPPSALTAPKPLVWGSLGQHYYGGKSQSQSQFQVVTPATNATTIETQNLSGTDQSALGTDVDLNARYSDASWDDRMVFRDSQMLSFLKDQPNRNYLRALYAEVRNLPTRTLVRVGRQQATWGGALARFDGIVAAYGLTPNLRLSAVGGRLADPMIDDLKPTFYGAVLDFDLPAGHWGGTAYALRQRVDGFTDRTAVGGEARYFDTNVSLLGLADYDVTFRALNIGMLQGTWQMPTGTSFNFLADYRRSPSLQLSNALLTGRNLTLQQFIETFGETDARSQARAITPVSKVVYVGFTHPFTPKWQAGADLRISSLSGTPEIGLLPAQPSTGNIYTWSAQLIGTGLLGNGDVTVVNASYLTGSINKAMSIGITERLQLRERWVFEPSLRYYRQHDSKDVKIWRAAPGFKLSYRLLDRLELEAEATFERTHTTSPTLDEDSTRRFYFIGYHWEF